MKKEDKILLVVTHKPIIETEASQFNIETVLKITNSSEPIRLA